MEMPDIDTLCQKLEQITEEEYKIGGYTPKKTIPEEPKGPKENLTDVIIMKSKFNQATKKKEQKSRIKIKKNVGDESENIIDKNAQQAEENKPIPDILEDDVFNIVKDENDYLLWRQISLEKRLELTEEYFEDNKYGIPISEDIRNEIITLIENNKLMTKKDIIFDKINCKLIDIPLLKYNDETFSLINRAKPKKKINNINKIIKNK